MSGSTRLRTPPDWHPAAQALVDGCARLPDPSLRLDLMDGACRSLGPRLYPAFLGVLALVSERASPESQQAVADTLAEGLSSGRIPAAPQGGWGRARGAGAAAMATLGPIEYVCAQYLQPVEAAGALSASALDASLRPLLSLLAQSPRAHRMYCERLEQAAGDPLESVWTRASRPALQALAVRWRAAPRRADEAVDALLSQARETRTGARALPGSTAPFGSASPFSSASPFGPAAHRAGQGR